MRWETNEMSPVRKGFTTLGDYPPERRLTCDEIALALGVARTKAVLAALPAIRKVAQLLSMYPVKTWFMLGVAMEEEHCRRFSAGRDDPRAS